MTHPISIRQLDQPLLDQPGFSSCVEHIGPKQATAYLLRNRDNNRPLNGRKVGEYEDVIRRGEWRLTPQGIIFDHNGRLIDGQHRLTAIVRSGRTVALQVTRDVDPDIFSVIDVGFKRTAGHIFTMQGEPQGAQLAAALQWLFNYEANTIETNCAAASAQQLFALLDAHPRLRDHLSARNRLRPRALLTPAVAIWLEYEFCRIDPERGRHFFDAFGQGEGLRAGMPALALRRRLDDNLAASAKLKPADLAAFVIKAWNLDRRGSRARVIRRVTGEPFPAIAGRS